MFFKYSLNKKNLFINMLFSVFILCILIVISISVIFSNIYLDSLYKQITEENQNGLERSISSMDNLINEIDQIYIYMQLNLDIYVYLNQTDSDEESKNRARIQANIIRQINPYIHSIQLYNSKSNDCITIGNVDVDINRFSDSNLMKQIKIYDRRYIFLSEIIQTPGQEGNKEYTISVVYIEQSTDNRRITNLAVINLNKELIIKDFLSGYEGITFIVNNDGVVFLYHLDNKFVMDNIGTAPYFKQITASNINKGSFKYKTGNDLDVITYFKNRESNLLLINIKSNKSIISTIQKRRNIVVFVSLIILLVYCVTGYFISKRIYSPIRKVTDVFNRSKYNIIGSHPNEVSLIMDVYKEVVNHAQHLETRNEDSIPKLREDYLRHILSTKVNKDISENIIRDYKIRIDFDNLIIAVIKIDNFSELEENEKIICDSYILTSTSEILEADFKCEVVNMFKGEIAVLLNYRNKEQNDFRTLVARFECLRDINKNNFNISITIGIGDTSNNPDECRGAYEKACYMAKHRFVLGDGKIIYQRYIDENLINSINYPKEIEEKLLNAVKLNKKEEFNTNLDRIIDILRNYNYTEAVIKILQIAIFCIKEVNQITNEINVKVNMNFGEFNNIFMELETLDHAKKWLLKVFDNYQTAVDAIKQMKNKDYYKVIEDAKNYVGEHFSDINLCVEVLAEKIGYSPNYFAKIFKDTTGVFINDYIRQVRINKAKELLKTSAYKINEISDMTGFINTNGFYSAFKREVGLTPASYRGIISHGNTRN